MAPGGAKVELDINEFVQDAKASGLIQKAIERGGTRGVTVAPLRQFK
jgi:hypothetical protein